MKFKRRHDPSPLQTAKTVGTIDAREAVRLIAADEAMLLDVRENDEWTAGHAPGATHLPLGDVDPGRVPATRPIVTVCRSGARSSKAAARLAAAGLTVHNLAGGMRAWEAAGLAVTRDDGHPGTVI